MAATERLYGEALDSADTLAGELARTDAALRTLANRLAVLQWELTDGADWLAAHSPAAMDKGTVLRWAELLAGAIGETADGKAGQG
jgi:hypothetical protein